MHIHTHIYTYTHIQAHTYVTRPAKTNYCVQITSGVLSFVVQNSDLAYTVKIRVLLQHPIKSKSV